MTICRSPIFWRCLAPILAVLGAIPASAQTSDSIDRPITIYVAGTAGGGIDLYARMVSRHLGRHIPGNPSVNVQVMPGAGGIRAAKFLTEQAPRDGTAMTTFAGGPILEPLIGARDPGYDMSKFTMIGAITKDLSLCTVMATAPVKTIEDAKRQQVVVAGTGAGSETDTWPIVLNEVLGTKFKLVTGYLGTQETILAMERGEAHGRCTFSLSALKTAKPDWLRDKKINVLVQIGVEKSAEFPDSPLIFDLPYQGRGSPAHRADGRTRSHGPALRRSARAAPRQGRAAAARIRRHHERSRIPRRGSKNPGGHPADHRRGCAGISRSPLCN